MNTLDEFKNLSDLLEASMEDAAKIAENPKYSFHMDSWHAFNEDRDVCYICQAGATMAMRLQVPRIDMSKFIEEIPEDTWCKLTSLNQCRLGKIFDAAYEFYGSDILKNKFTFYNKFPYGRTSYPTYGINYCQEYIEAMHRLVKDLREIGL